MAGEYADRLRSVVRTRQRRGARPATDLDVLALMVDHGVTVTTFVGHFAYEPGRERNITAAVFIAPSVLEESGFTEFVDAAPPIRWEWGARALMSAWARAYGLDDGFQAELEGGVVTTALEFQIGRAAHVDFDYAA
jgi:hypothetical protein